MNTETVIAWLVAWFVGVGAGLTVSTLVRLLVDDKRRGGPNIVGYQPIVPPGKPKPPPKCRGKWYPPATSEAPPPPAAPPRPLVTEGEQLGNIKTEAGRDMPPGPPPARKGIEVFPAELPPFMKKAIRGMSAKTAFDVGKYLREELAKSRPSPSAPTADGASCPGNESVFVVTRASMRPAAPDREECYYCKQPLGGKHTKDCPCVVRPVRVRMTVEFERMVPASWDKDTIEFQMAGSSWCSNNAIADLEKYAARIGCLCDAKHTFEFLSDAGAERLSETSK